MNKKSFIFYFVTILVFAFLVVAKQKSITKKNEKECVTFYSAWKKEGRPVSVKKAQKGDMERALKLTLLFQGENTYTGYLPKAFIQGLSLKSPVSIRYNGKKIPCKILEIAPEMDLDTGMYPIKISCFEKLPQTEGKYVAEVAVLGLKDVFILPQDSIYKEEGKTFVWVIKEGKAYKKFITLQERSCDGVVAKGIDEKDLIIIQGAASINESDPVKFNDEK